VLEDVSFVAHPGQTIALVGATGSGKTTVANLIPRFYDVTSGQVMVDGLDVRDVTLGSLRRQIGIVMQETTLFSGSIRENIGFGKADATEDDITWAANSLEPRSSSHVCRRATTRASASAVCHSPADRNNGWRSLGRC